MLMKLSDGAVSGLERSLDRPLAGAQVFTCEKHPWDWLWMRLSKRAEHPCALTGPEKRVCVRPHLMEGFDDLRTMAGVKYLQIAHRLFIPLRLA